MKELDQLDAIVGGLNIQPLIESSAKDHSKTSAQYKDQLTKLNTVYSNMPENFKRLMEDYRKNLSDPNTSPELVQQLTQALKNAVAPLRNSQENLAMINWAYTTLKSTLDDVLIQSKQKSSTANPEQTQTTELTEGQQLQKTTEAIKQMRTIEAKIELSEAKENSTELLTKLSLKLDDMLSKAEFKIETALVTLQKLCAGDLPKLLPSIKKVDNVHALNEGISEVTTLLDQGKMPDAIQKMQKTLFDNIPGVKELVAVSPPPIVHEQKINTAPAPECAAQGAPPPFALQHIRDNTSQVIARRIGAMQERATQAGDKNLLTVINKVGALAKQKINDPKMVDSLLDRLEKKCNKDLGTQASANPPQGKK